MITSTIITKNEYDILKKMIGKCFQKFKCDPFIYTPMVYGVVGLYIDNNVYKLTSLFDNVKRFLANDDVAKFKLECSNDESIKTFMDNGKLINNYVNQTINTITVVNDHQSITYEDKVYKFNSTVGIIFKLDDDLEISFEIGTWFSEMITIKKGYDLLDKFTPIDDFYEEWKDCEGYEPKCTREVVVIGTDQSYLN